MIAEISELYRRFPDVKNYYQLKFSPQSERDIVNEYKERVKKEFFPTRGFGRARLSIAKKPIIEYKKVCFNPASLIDLMLYYVEQGVNFTNQYGDINEPFYNSMESMFDQALKLIQETNSQDTFFPVVVLLSTILAILVGDFMMAYDLFFPTFTTILDTEKAR